MVSSDKEKKMHMFGTLALPGMVWCVKARFSSKKEDLPCASMALHKLPTLKSTNVGLVN